MSVTRIESSIKNSIHNAKGKLKMAFNSQAFTAVRAVIEGSEVGYKAITLAAGVGLLATSSLPMTAAIVVGVTALAAFVAVNDYRRILNNQQPVLGARVEGAEAEAARALKVAKVAQGIPRILESMPRIV